MQTTRCVDDGVDNNLLSRTYKFLIVFSSLSSSHFIAVELSAVDDLLTTLNSSILVSCCALHCAKDSWYWYQVDW